MVVARDLIVYALASAGPVEPPQPGKAIDMQGKEGESKFVREVKVREEPPQKWRNIRVGWLLVVVVAGGPEMVVCMVVEGEREMVFVCAILVDWELLKLDEANEAGVSENGNEEYERALLL